MLKILKASINYFTGNFWLPKSTQEDTESLNKLKVINKIEKVKELPMTEC